ncbi:VacJ family lipoprotein [Thalassolituus pacificus]|uniref:VacJ family lipoprotein n=1 Tax=Thalassolituus pacificus TaxID=2975440 RepID=A0A9X3ARY4_9GAMM|nr:VacJ family lipoprotein [Thalassolituus pacificus]MCT7359795.1 VacJ family lipoprotein [Thalassolituus pacificus]
MRAAWLLLLCLASSLSWAAETKDPDPWEGFNRSMFAFNENLDKYIAKPMAQGYQYITPEPVDQSVTHFFSNLGDVLVIVNDIGQLKMGQALSDTARFLINSTVGFFGIFDVASHIGLPKHDEDFGQTLGYWGVGSGPYLMLPFLGPSTLRDGTGLLIDYQSDLGYTGIGNNYAQEVGLYTVRGVDLRADLIASEGLISGDRYTFIRSFYLQRREYLINDGVVQDEFGDDFDDFDDFDDEEDRGDDWDQ